MSTPTAEAGRTPASEDRKLLSRLGLNEGASRAELEAAHADVLDFLRTAPASLRDWARSRVEETDEAFALLSDPDRTPEVPEPPTVERVPAQASGRRIWIPLGLLAIAVLVLGVYSLGRGPAVPGISGEPTDTAAAGQGSAAAADGTVPLDQAEVDRLTSAVEADPTDLTSMRSLADLYFAAGDYAQSATWEQKILDRNPDDATALLALGAAQFNSGDAASAERSWLRVIDLQPDLAEAHYDLGFLYLSQDPPDMDKVQREWEKVVSIDPDSEIAATVSQHLDSLQTQPPATGQDEG
jgi:tetratricopeptide (TPR) repeat protein